jgi:hypothetical protein
LIAPHVAESFIKLQKGKRLRKITPHYSSEAYLGELFLENQIIGIVDDELF